MRTLIPLEKMTAGRIKALRLTRYETYDEIIIRLITVFELTQMKIKQAKDGKYKINKAPL